MDWLNVRSVQIGAPKAAAVTEVRKRTSSLLSAFILRFDSDPVQETWQKHFWTFENFTKIVTGKSTPFYGY
jgi:hypothetical protein